jgi:hypothetical protein
MNELLLQDASEHPEVFVWAGAINAGVVRAWIRDERLVVPLDLVELWERTGGGTMFESEELLVPVAGEERDGTDGAVASIVSRTREYHARGLAGEYVLFSEGLFLSALRQPSGTIVTLDPRSLKETDQFPSLDEWYRRTLREQFAWRYRLTSP